MSDIKLTVKCPRIEKPVNEFTCVVERLASHMRYQDADGTFKPVQPAKTENWIVLAETQNGAEKIAAYHFYCSNIISVFANTIAL